MTLLFESDVLPTGVSLDEARALAARTHELDRAHVFHSWSAQAEIDPMTIVAAQGSYVWDGDGRRPLDFSSQLVNTNIGHQHPKWLPPSRNRPPGFARSRRNTPTTRDPRLPG